MKNIHNWQLYHWHLELSSKCSLKCPRCPRTELPDTPWMNLDWSLEEFKSVFTEDLLKNHVKRITLCGDIGDPIYAKDFVPIIEYIKTINSECHTVTITNGSHKKPQWWHRLASVLNEYDTINFSVDGYNNFTNNLYRKNSNFESIMEGMSIIANNSDAFVVWAAIYFSFNQDHQDKILNLAKKNNCDSLQWTKSTKFGSKYGDAYQGENDSLEPREEYISGTHRYSRHTIDISGRKIPNHEYMQLNKKKYQEVQPIGDIVPLCMIGNRGLYLSADGVLHPCSWTSFPYVEMSDENKTIKYEDSFFSKHRQELNVKTHGIDSVLNSVLWEKLFHSWETSPWVECNLKCNKKYVDENYAVGWETN